MRLILKILTAPIIVVLTLFVWPCRNGSRHLRYPGSDYPSDYKRDHPAGDGVPCQSIRNPDGGGMAARQDTGFAVRDSGSGLRLKSAPGYDTISIYPRG